jgi:hypothetical protein
VDYLSFDTIESAPDGTQQLVSAPEKLRDTYGNFEIAVYESSTRPQAHEASPDERGIRWLRLLREVGPRPGKYLVAEKSYGSNIVLKWYPEGDRKETTPQWDRLRTAGVRSCSATSLHAHRSSAAASSVRRRPLIVE